MTKFFIESISTHSNFTSALWTMDVLTLGVDDILIESGYAIGAATPEVVSNQVIPNLIISYNNK